MIIAKSYIVFFCLLQGDYIMHYCSKKTLKEKNIFVLFVLFFFLLQTQIVFASLTNIRYTYDKLNRITSINYNNSTSLIYDYDASGNIIKTKIVCNTKKIGLNDAIIVLQILSNVKTDEIMFFQDDINGNDRLDIAEIVYMLQYISKDR